MSPGLGLMVIVTALVKNLKVWSSAGGLPVRNTRTLDAFRMMSLSDTRSSGRLLDLNSSSASIQMKTCDSKAMVVLSFLTYSESWRRRPPHSFFSFRRASRTDSRTSSLWKTSCLRMAPIMLAVVCSRCSRKSQYTTATKNSL